MATADYNGVQKAAILLITLGPERSADIFKHLKEEEIEELTLEIANTRSVSPQVKEDILNEFYQVCLAQQYIAEGGIGYAKELLDKALGHAELSLSCPRLRPIINNDKINPRDVGEKQLCQVLCAYRLFLPFVGITVSSRESAQFRNGITKICATKVSAGVSTGIGDHESKYTGKEDGDAGDEQFEINDNRSFDRMYKDMEDGGLQPVVNEYIYV